MPNQAVSPKLALDAMREALAEKVRKEIACTRTYTMQEWAVIETALSTPVPSPSDDVRSALEKRCLEFLLADNKKRSRTTVIAAGEFADFIVSEIAAIHSLTVAKP